MKYRPSLFASILFTASLSGAVAADLILDNGGLKNTYRLVFEEISPEQQFVRGVVEILGDESERKVAHTRLPFSGTLHPAEGGAGGAERLELRSSPLVAFFPPADVSESSPPITGWLYGRGTKSPGANLELWSFDGEADKWQPVTMSFGTVPEATSADDWLAEESLGGLALVVSQG